MLTSAAFTCSAHMSSHCLIHRRSELTQSLFLRRGPVCDRVADWLEIPNLGEKIWKSCPDYPRLWLLQAAGLGQRVVGSTGK